MKAFTLLLSFAWAVPALAQSHDYRLISVPHAAIDQHLVIGTAATNTPAPLRGLWWMDGNPLPDKIVSFAGATFTPVIEHGEVVGYDSRLPVYDEGVWSWDDTDEGRALYDGVLQSRLTYHARFNKEFTHGDVAPVVQLAPPLPPLEIPQTLLLDFSMNKVNDDEFSRDSIILGSFFAYRFRRVVDAEGRRLPAYADYLKSLRDRGLVNALLPVCDANAGKVLPTVCSL